MTRPRPWATYALILLNVLDYVWVATTGGFDSNLSLFDHGALYGRAVLAGQWWRIVTGAFTHGGLLHIGANMWALYQVGTFVEVVAGRARMLAIYAVSMVVSGLAVVYFTPDTLTVGASGAIFGLFGAMVAIGIRLGPRGRTLIAQTLPIIILNLIITFSIPYISAAAHVGGLISGFLFGLAIFYLQPRRVQLQERAMVEGPAAIEERPEEHVP